MAADLAFEALCDVCGIDWQDGEITADQRGRVNAALKQLRAVYEHDVTLPTMIHERAYAYRQVFPEMPVTPQALTAHWSSIIPQLEQRREETQKRESAKRNLANAHARRGCQRCRDDHWVIVGQDANGGDITAPCPDCNGDLDASYWVQRTRVQVMNADQAREILRDDEIEV